MALLATGVTFLLAGPGAPPAAAQQSQPIAVILEASGARVASSVASPGGTVFSGDILSTGSGGRLQLQAGRSRFTLSSDSIATIHSRASGVVADLERGTMLFSSDTGEGLEVVVSDVRILPRMAQATLGEVSILNACQVRVTSQRNLLTMLRGKETRALEENVSYVVTPENSIETRQDSRISPDDAGFHSMHTHRPCPVPATGARLDPVAKIAYAAQLVVPPIIAATVGRTSVSPTGP